MCYPVTRRACFIARRLFFSLIAFLLVSCGGGSSQNLLVFAAASLAEPLSELGVEFSSKTGVGIDFSFDGSGALAQRIRRGAPADLFVAAGAGPVDLLEGEGWIDTNSRLDLLTNSLVLIRSKEQGMIVTSMEALKTPEIGRIAIADPFLSPAGVYAQNALEGLGLWQEVKFKVIPSASVRVALGYVETGVADVGIVYRTEAHLSPRVEVVLALPQESHVSIVYPGAVLKEADHGQQALRFLEFLGGEEGREVFLRHGFVPAREGATGGNGQ